MGKEKGRGERREGGRENGKEKKMDMGKKPRTANNLGNRH